ncbi:RNA helicase [Aspergillus nanangensis]|uniref:RNA helicase n=1 Tax=Aspergillus nanangensis TaxID=2582783 RepID=A0AAD4CYD3_ASPNN|nr:RNA helicase [Aspergillus nanangensis]
MVQSRQPLPVLYPPASRPPAHALLRNNFCVTPPAEIKESPARPSLRSHTRNERKNVTSPDFSAVVESLLHELKRRLTKKDDSAMVGWQRFERYVMNACKLDDRGSSNSFSPLRQVKTTLQKAYIRTGQVGLRHELEFLMYAEETTSKFSAPNLEQQRKVADLRFPAEWYPQARSMQRTIHLHVGPTNSGKTYHALKRLEASKSGFYAGPLRLLAQEVYNRFQASGISCSLVTGDEVKIPEGQAPSIVSNTVEMVNLGQPYEVGVIDEIQMMADTKRGWAWTRAVLGSRAKELHLCGETRAVPLVRELAALTGDKLEIHRYERLNPLKVMEKSLKGDLRNLQKGDCLVAFSRVGIHALKADIEKVTGRRAAIVYGSLPAEIRTQQASLFNDSSNDYDYLVASDAIGMGLNLSVKRIIFETLVKRVPGGLQRLTVPEIKQIAGRAGRYRSAAQQGNKKNADDGSNIGLVTSLEEVDLPYIRQAMGVEPSPLAGAGLLPPDPVFQKFAAYFPPSVPLEYIIKRLVEVSQVHPLFFMCEPRGQLENAEVIDTVGGLQFEDQLMFMAAPMYTRNVASRDTACAFAQCVAEHTGGRLLDIPGLNLEILEETVSGSKEYLSELEILHKSVILYSWLSYRFGGVFTDRTLAAHVKELVEERMVRALTEFSANKKLRKDASLRRQIALQKQIQDQRRRLAESDLDSLAAQEAAGAVPVDLSADENPLEGVTPEPQTT